MALVAVFITLIFLVSLVSGRLERIALTLPIVFTLAGMLAGFLLATIRTYEGSKVVLLVAAEIGLVLLLFTDASRTDLRVLTSIRNLPIRLLSVGLVLTILFGWLAAQLIFRQLSIWEAAILATILAPTDAGLGQVIVTSPRLPIKIREALNVEAGLNDGICVPFLLFFIALTSANPQGEQTSLTYFVVEQLGYGTLIGVAVGLVGGWLLGLSLRRQWIAPSWRKLGLVALPLLCAVSSEAVGASMFIAAFVAGLAVQFGFKRAGKQSVEFTEETGQLLNLSVFFLFGLLVVRAWGELTLAHVYYAILSLTIVRMLPVAISLIGSGLSRATMLFLGWFGPRGLASLVLGLVYLEQVSHQRDESTIRLAIMATVLMSIFAHGVTAVPGMALYERKLQTLPPTAAEFDGEGNGHS